MNLDLLIYVVHGLFWLPFGVARALVRRRAPATAPAPATAAPAATTARTAPWSRALVWVHTLAFAVLYWGLGTTVLADQVPTWFAGQRVVGTLVIATGSALMCWALLHFESWRFRAQLGVGHRLATGGPFRWVRHPIYLGLALFALGSAVWVPTAPMWTAFALMALGSDLRARAEERLLTAEFGSEYTAFCARVRRFIPGLY